MPPFRALWYFACVMREGSICGAADQLCVSAPAVSKQIKLLEDLLGHQLFKRHPRSVIATREGRRLFECLAEPFSELEDLWQLSLEDLDTILQIACHPIYARYALQSILICPEAKTLRDQFAVLPVDDPEMLFLDDHDVIYTCAQTETKGWNSTVLFDEQIALLSAPMAIGPMPMDTPLLLYRPSHEKNLCFADWIEYSDNEYLFDRPVIHCDSYDLALHGALAGTGAMLGCLNFNARLIASGRLAADERCIVSTGRRHQIAIREGRPMTEPIVALARLLINNDT